MTLEACVARIGEALDTCSTPPVLVGHSMGGMIISAAAEAWPDRIRSLVYVAAFLPRNHQSLADMEARNPDPRVPGATLHLPDGTVAIDLQRVATLFYNDCSPEDIALARQRLRPQAMGPILARVRITRARYARVPRIYIECSQDQAVCPAMQRIMHGAWPGTTVRSLSSSHSPFFSMPGALARLLSLAASG